MLACSAFATLARARPSSVRPAPPAYSARRSVERERRVADHPVPCRPRCRRSCTRRAARATVPRRFAVCEEPVQRRRAARLVVIDVGARRPRCAWIVAPSIARACRRGGSATGRSLITISVSGPPHSRSSTSATCSRAGLPTANGTSVNSPSTFCRNGSCTSSECSSACVAVVHGHLRQVPDARRRAAASIATRPSGVSNAVALRQREPAHRDAVRTARAAPRASRCRSPAAARRRRAPRRGRNRCSRRAGRSAPSGSRARGARRGSRRASRAGRGRAWSARPGRTCRRRRRYGLRS